MELICFDSKDLKEKMQENNINNLSEVKNTAILTTSNFGGMIILINETADMVFIQEVWDTGEKEIKEKEIKYNKEGKAYFKYESEEYFLEEFVKRNWRG